MEIFIIKRFDSYLTKYRDETFVIRDLKWHHVNMRAGKGRSNLGFQTRSDRFSHIVNDRLFS